MTITAAINATGAFDPDTHFISLDRMRREFRVPQDEMDRFETSEDPLIVAVVESAASAVARAANVPVLRESAVLQLPGNALSGASPYEFADLFARDVTAIYRRATENADPVALAADQFSARTPSDIPQLVAGRVCLMPATEWPDAAGWVVTYTRGITPNWRGLGTAQSALVVRARSDLDGMGIAPAPERSTFERLIDLIRVAPHLPDGAAVVG